MATYQLLDAVMMKLILDEEAPKSVFTGIKTDTRKRERVRAMRRYDKYLNKVQEKGCNSRLVARLTEAVGRANAMVNKWHSAGKPQGIAQDAVEGIQLRIFRAADWLRRFVYDRSDDKRWFDTIENEDAQKLIDELNKNADKIEGVLRDNPRSARLLKLQTLKETLLPNQLLEEHPAVRRLDNRLDLLKENMKALVPLMKDVEEIFEIDEGHDILQPRYESVNTLLRAIGAREFRSREQRTHAIPAWRVKGLRNLGPLGVLPCETAGARKVKVENFLETNIEALFRKQVPTDEELGQRPMPEYWLSKSYLEKNPGFKEFAGLKGRLSPINRVSIPKGDITFSLIRIPPTAKYFAWAYPIMPSVEDTRRILKRMKDDQQPPSPTHLFLLVGGYVYWDKNMRFIRANAIYFGGIQLQFSSPFRLTRKVRDELEQAGRFMPVTVDFPDARPTKFAWILPGEFTDRKKYGDDALIPSRHPGAFAFLYDDDTDASNVFVLAATDSIIAKQRVNLDEEEDFTRSSLVVDEEALNVRSE